MSLPSVNKGEEERDQELKLPPKGELAVKSCL